MKTFKNVVEGMGIGILFDVIGMSSKDLQEAKLDEVYLKCFKKVS